MGMRRLVIMVLVDTANGKQRHVPYRDSKLTFLLQVCLPSMAERSASWESMASMSPVVLKCLWSVHHLFSAKHLWVFWEYPCYQVFIRVHEIIESFKRFSCFSLFSFGVNIGWTSLPHSSFAAAFTFGSFWNIPDKYFRICSTRLNGHVQPVKAV